MAKIGRIARILGPRGLMPNPKTGTVTMDVTKAVADIKGGKITFRVDKHSNLHLIIGKASFTESQLVDNYAAVLDEVLRAKPSAAKGKYLRKVILATTMGPGVPVDPNVVKNLTEGADRRLSRHGSHETGRRPCGGAPVSSVVAGCGDALRGRLAAVRPPRTVGAPRGAGRHRTRTGRRRARPQRGGQVDPAADSPPACSARPAAPCGTARGVVGWVPERFPADQPFTVGQYLTGMGRLRGLSGRRRPGRPSTGGSSDSASPATATSGCRSCPRAPRRRWASRRPCSGSPGLLVLDEPWEGLDAATRELVPELIHEVLDDRRHRCCSATTAGRPRGYPGRPGGRWPRARVSVDEPAAAEAISVVEIAVPTARAAGTVAALRAAGHQVLRVREEASR